MIKRYKILASLILGLLPARCPVAMALQCGHCRKEK